MRKNSIVGLCIIMVGGTSVYGCSGGDSEPTGSSAAAVSQPAPRQAAKLPPPLVIDPTDARIAAWGRWGNVGGVLRTVGESYLTMSIRNTSFVSVYLDAPEDVTVQYRYAFFSDGDSVTFANDAGPCDPMADVPAGGSACLPPVTPASRGWVSIPHSFQPDRSYTLVIYADTVNAPHPPCGSTDPGYASWWPEQEWYTPSKTFGIGRVWLQNQVSAAAPVLDAPGALSNPPLSIEFAGASITAGDYPRQAAYAVMRAGHWGLQYSQFGYGARPVGGNDPAFPGTCLAEPASRSDWLPGPSGLVRTNFSGSTTPVSALRASDVFVVDFGAVDALHTDHSGAKTFAENAAVFNADLVTYLRGIRAAYPGTRIFVLRGTPCYGDSTSDDYVQYACEGPGLEGFLSSAEMTNAYAAAVATLDADDAAAGRPATTILFDAFADGGIDRASWKSNTDGFIHPNAHGAQLLGRAIGARIAKELP